MCIFTWNRQKNIYFWVIKKNCDFQDFGKTTVSNPDLFKIKFSQNFFITKMTKIYVATNLIIN